MHVTVSTKSDAWDAMSSTVAQYSKGGQTETETEDPSTHSDQRTICGWARRAPALLKYHSLLPQSTCYATR